MKARGIPSFVGCPCLLMLLLACGAYAESNASETSEAPPPESSLEKPENPWSNSWHFFWGASNLQPRLEESEEQIDTELNGILGGLIPGWKNPITFADWRDDMKLWDFHAGVARDLGPKFTWFAAVGGSGGTIRNREKYHLLALPIKAKIDFTRRIMCAGCGLSYYPWGKPAFNPAGEGSRLLRPFRTAKPFVEGALYYAYVKAIADAKLTLPGVTTLLHIHEEEGFDLVYLSPRLGLEAPLGKKDSLLLETGYGFFTSHSSEFDGLYVYLFHKHRF